MTYENIHFFVGYDIREHAAWLVCKAALEKRGALSVQPLSHRALRRDGLFDRTWTIDAGGQYIDDRDGRPFSTEFSHSRFLVPYLAKQQGLTGYVAFVDCDFLFFDPIADLAAELDQSKVVSVVKHDFARVVEGLKMDDMAQQRYWRKLWSSLMVWNMDHPDLGLFHPLIVNTMSGGQLHGLLGIPDEQIGAIPERWNYIPTHSDRSIIPAAVHWSFGGPWMKGYEDVEFAGEWMGEYEAQVRNVLVARNFDSLFPIL